MDVLYRPFRPEHLAWPRPGAGGFYGKKGSQEVCLGARPPFLMWASRWQTPKLVPARWREGLWVSTCSHGRLEQAEPRLPARTPFPTQEGSKTRPSPPSGGRPGLAVFLLLFPEQGPGGQDVCHSGCRWLQRGPAGRSSYSRGPYRGVRGVQGPSLGTPGKGEGWREVWG